MSELDPEQGTEIKDISAIQVFRNVSKRIEFFRMCYVVYSAHAMVDGSVPVFRDSPMIWTYLDTDLESLQHP